MFHIFRWQRDDKNDNTTTPNQQYKRHHARKHRLRIYQESLSFQNLLHTKRLRSSSKIDKYQVTIN
jgi:hypothetical protein